MTAPRFFEPEWTVAPGEHISEYMELSDITPELMSELLGVSATEMRRILTGEAPITQDIAERIERHFGGINAETLMAIQRRATPGDAETPDEPPAREPLP